jgi:hypothetical protein
MRADFTFLSVKRKGSDYTREPYCRGNLPEPLHQSHFSFPRASYQKPFPSQREHLTVVSDARMTSLTISQTIENKTMNTKSRANIGSGYSGKIKKLFTSMRYSAG